MSGISAKAYAKLNITLDVGQKRPDGYHEIRMVMQSVSLCDDIEITLTDSGRISARSNLPYLPTGARNIAVKAAELFFKTAGIQDMGAVISIHKRIPVCAGLGGGSSDAAAVLRALNAHTGCGFSRGELERMARELGSDVPFCVAGGTALATGRGELLEYLPPMPACAVVICKPDFSISTPELFSRIDARSSKFHPDTDGVVRALENGDLPGVAHRMYNVFEDVLPRQFNTVSGIKGELLESGALGAVMTGTGSAVFGIFDEGAKAQAACKKLSVGGRNCFLAQIQGRLDV